MSERDLETIEEGQEVEAEAKPEGPGRQLREAREAKGLSLEQVAKELRLNPRKVSALEENDSANLPPPAFVLGYLRSYAKLVDLQPDAIVSVYERSLEGGQPRIVSRVRDSQVTSRDLPVRLVTWAIFIGMAALLVAWWTSQQPLEESGVADVGSAVGDAPPGRVVPAPGPQEGLSDPVPVAPEPTQPVTAAESMPVESAPAVAPAVVPAEPASATEEPGPEADTTTGLPLRLVFAADSWTEVTDSNGRRLVYDLIKAGRTLELTGTPPFTVFLGYAPSVTVYYRGERFDHTPYIRRDIARFQVGSAGDGQEG